MPNYKLMAFDLDGTLLHRDGGVSEENRLWLRKAQEANIQVTIATGRHVRGLVESLAKELSIVAPLCTVNGGEVWTSDGFLLERHTLDPSDVSFLKSLAEDNGCNFWASTVEGPVDWQRFSGKVTDYDWLKFGIFSHRLDVIDALWQSLRETGRFELSSSGRDNIEVNPAGVSKATGMSVVCNYLNLEPSEVMVVGDGLNDVRMFEWAGYAVAMGNASAEVKEKADFVTAPCSENGVAMAIQQVLKLHG